MGSERRMGSDWSWTRVENGLREGVLLLRPVLLLLGLTLALSSLAPLPASPPRPEPELALLSARSLSFVLSLSLLTTAIALLYVYNWIKLLKGMVVMAQMHVTAQVVGAQLSAVVVALGLTLDWPSLLLLLWNFGWASLVGSIWGEQSPLAWQQSLCLLQALALARSFLTFLHLQGAAQQVWGLLILASIWDVAALSPLGPLRFLIDAVEKGGDSYQGFYFQVDLPRPRAPPPPPEEKEEEEEEESDTVTLTPQSSRESGIESETESEPSSESPLLPEPKEVRKETEKVAQEPKEESEEAVGDDGGWMRLGMGDLVLYSIIQVHLLSSGAHPAALVAGSFGLILGFLATMALTEWVTTAPALPLPVFAAFSLSTIADIAFAPIASLAALNVVFF